MEKKYTCPVCNKEGTLSELNACILAHLNEFKNEEKEAKKKEIEKLKTENERLIEKIKENCRRLDELGLMANINYTISPKREQAKTKSSCNHSEEFPNLEDFIRTIYKEIL